MDSAKMATPRPWTGEAHPRLGGFYIYDGNDGIVIGPMGKGRAELIVRAVNAHDALVEALQEQWEYAHADHCRHLEEDGECEMGSGCHWPKPDALRLAGELEAREVPK